jgi:hypothetical protein
MNEVAWLGGSDPTAMLDYLADKGLDRKLRLFACACVRRCWSRVKFAPERNAVETAERFAEGEAKFAALQQARERAEQHAAEVEGAPQFEQFVWEAAVGCCADDALEAARTVCESMRRQAVREEAYGVPAHFEAQVVAEASSAECAAQAELLREVLGNVFRPCVVNWAWTQWNGGAVLSMAREIDDEGRFGELPYLGDALEDAGCGDEQVLRHCRGSTNHVRGCWVLDALLGRS